MPFVLHKELQKKSESLELKVPMEQLELMKEAKGSQSMTCPSQTLVNLLNIPDHDSCTGTLSIELYRSSWEFVFTLKGPSDNNQDYKLTVPEYSRDVRTTMTIEVGSAVEQDKGIQKFPSDRQVGIISGEFSEYVHAMPVSMEELESLTKKRPWAQLTLCLFVDVTVFTQTSGSWKRLKLSCIPAISSNAAPYIQHLTERKKADLVLECNDGVEFPAHTLVLKCVSPVFERMLEADMKEGAERRVVIPDLTADTVKEMLEFIYTGSFTKSRLLFNSTEQVIELLHCADKYDINELKMGALENMKVNLNVKNAIEFVKAAKTYAVERQDVIDEMLSYCKRNLSQFPKDDEFKQFLLENMDTLI